MIIRGNNKIEHIYIYYRIANKAKVSGGGDVAIKQEEGTELSLRGGGGSEQEKGTKLSSQL